MLRKNLPCLLMALLVACILFSSALSEEEVVVSTPVEDAVQEIDGGALPSDDAEFNLAPQSQEGVAASLNGNGIIPIDAAHFPDAVLRKCVWNFDDDADGFLSEDERAAVDNIYVSDSGVSSLAGIEWFPNVEQIQCEDNQLTTLDVSIFPNLTYLACGNNQLTSLNVRGCTALTELYCEDNKLTTLDVSGCSSLTQLLCNYNRLSSLNVKGCNALTGLYCENNQLTALNVSSCAALEGIGCSANKLTALDVSGCAALEKLGCGENPLTTLNVNGCTALKELYCSFTQLTTLNVSGCAELMQLSCQSCQLTTLNVEGCSKLQWMYCDNNRLVSLDVRDCTILDYLGCYNNQLTALNVSGCASLLFLHCDHNQIPSINLSGCDTLKPSALKTPYTSYDGTVGLNLDEETGQYYIYIDSFTALVIDGQVVCGKLPTSLAKAKVTAKDKTYTGKALEPAVTVTLNGEMLVKDKDYTVVYTNNKKVGKATITITGKGGYNGTASGTFKINPKAVSGLKLTAGKKSSPPSGRRLQTPAGTSFSTA